MKGERGQGSGRRRWLSSVSLWAQLPPAPGEDHGDREPSWGRGRRRLRIFKRGQLLRQRSWHTPARDLNLGGGQRNSPLAAALQPKAAVNPARSKGSRWDFCPRNVPQHPPQGPLHLPGPSCSALPPDPPSSPEPGLGTRMGMPGDKPGRLRHRGQQTEGGPGEAAMEGPVAPQAHCTRSRALGCRTPRPGWALCPAFSSHGPGGWWSHCVVCWPLLPPRGFLSSHQGHCPASFQRSCPLPALLPPV